MELVKYEMEVPKESKEVVDLLNAVLENVKAKKSVTEYSNVLDELMLAVEGVGGIAEEIKSNYKDELAGYMVHKLMGTLLTPAVVPPAA